MTSRGNHPWRLRHCEFARRFRERVLPFVLGMRFRAACRNKWKNGRNSTRNSFTMFTARKSRGNPTVGGNSNGKSSPQHRTQDRNRFSIKKQANQDQSNTCSASPLRNVANSRMCVGFHQARACGPGDLGMRVLSFEKYKRDSLFI